MAPFAIQRKDYVQAMARQMPAQLFGPFDHRRPVLQGLIEAKLEGFVGAFETEEIEMRHAEALADIELHEGEAGAGNLGLSRRDSGDHATRQHRFANPQGTGEADGLSATQGVAHSRSEVRGVGVMVETEIAGGGQEHGRR